MNKQDKALEVAYNRDKQRGVDDARARKKIKDDAPYLEKSNRDLQMYCEKNDSEMLSHPQCVPFLRKRCIKSKLTGPGCKTFADEKLACDRSGLLSDNPPKDSNPEALEKCKQYKPVPRPVLPAVPEAVPARPSAAVPSAAVPAAAVPAAAASPAAAVQGPRTIGQVQERRASFGM
jgi:hypothetical protein